MRHVLVEQPKPMMEMNTTPLIDVMLVLLIMFIITIPIQTHAVKFDLPQPCQGCTVLRRDVNTVSVSRTGQIAWNASPIPETSLAPLLRQTQQMERIPELHLRPDPDARFGTVDEVLAIIKREHVKRFGFVGNEALPNSF